MEELNIDIKKATKADVVEMLRWSEWMNEEISKELASYKKLIPPNHQLDSWISALNNVGNKDTNLIILKEWLEELKEKL